MSGPPQAPSPTSSPLILKISLNLIHCDLKSKIEAASDIKNWVRKSSTSSSSSKTHLKLGTASVILPLVLMLSSFLLNRTAMHGFDAIQLSCLAFSNGIHASISVCHAFQDISKSAGLCAALCCLTPPNPACCTWCAHPEQVDLHVSPLLLCANLRLQTYDLVVVLNHGRAAASEIEHLQRGTHLLSRHRHWRTGSVSATSDSLYLQQ
ncbi:hypothetical protein COP1_014380 [Malus domestica]